MIAVFKITHKIYDPKVSLKMIWAVALEVTNINLLITHFTMIHQNAIFLRASLTALE